MRSPFYLRQLKRDLIHWVEAGLVDAQTAETMYNEASQGAAARSLSSILTILGAMLLVLAALSFVAANFWGIDKSLQLALLFGSLVVAYGTGGYFLATQRAWLGQAAILLGLGLFGVNIMMVAQIYHINAHYPDGTMAWAIGALLTAVLVPSRPALAATFVLAAIWTSQESFEFGVPLHWPFLLLWGVGFITAHAMRWPLGFHLGMLAFIYWLSLNSSAIADHFDWNLKAVAPLYALVWLGLWAKSLTANALHYPYAEALERYSVALFLFTFFIMHLSSARHIGEIDLVWRWIAAGLGVAVLVIGLAAWAAKGFTRSDILGLLGTLAATLAFPFLIQTQDHWIIWGYRGVFIAIVVWILGIGVRREDRFLINLSLVAFGAEILLIYFNAFDTLLSQSVFFAAGGVLLIVVGLGLDRLRRRLTATPAADAHSEEAEHAEEAPL